MQPLLYVKILLLGSYLVDFAVFFVSSVSRCILDDHEGGCRLSICCLERNSHILTSHAFNDYLIFVFVLAYMKLTFKLRSVTWCRFQGDMITLMLSFLSKHYSGKTREKAPAYGRSFLKG